MILRVHSIFDFGKHASQVLKLRDVLTSEGVGALSVKEIVNVSRGVLKL